VVATAPANVGAHDLTAASGRQVAVLLDGYFRPGCPRRGRRTQGNRRWGLCKFRG